MMGLMLSVSLIAGGTVGVYAAQTNAKTETTTEAASEEESESESETASEEEIAEQNAVYGEVKSVDGDTINFTVGTRNEIPGKGDKPEGEKPEEAPDKPDGEKESFLTLTSEEREITVSEETEIVKGMMPEDGKPENEKPEGNKPEGDAPMAEEENQKDTEEVSEEDTEETTEVTADKKSAESVPEEKEAGADQKEEKLTVKDIKAGDVIKVTYDKDNNVTKIEVMSIPEADEKPETAQEDSTEKEEVSEETTEATTES